MANYRSGQKCPETGTYDYSLGWDAIAERFMAIRSGVGTALVRAWARDNLTPPAAVLDIGCGSGFPIARALVDDGFEVSGIDASPSLIAAFRRNIPGAPAACEPAQNSDFFGRNFAGVISIGLIFLLETDDQLKLLARVASALQPGGHFLFSAPQQACEWRDTLTDRLSISLGRDAYERHLTDTGLNLMGCQVDEGGNHYYDAVKTGPN